VPAAQATIFLPSAEQASDLQLRMGAEFENHVAPELVEEYMGPELSFPTAATIVLPSAEQAIANQGALGMLVGCQFCADAR
jgi:hypothetical protein